MFRVPSISGLFKWRQFEPEVILLAVGWYLRFSLSYRDVKELLAELGLHADHVTVWRWVQRYAPEMERRLRSRLKPTNDRACLQSMLIRSSLQSCNTAGSEPARYLVINSAYIFFVANAMACQLNFSTARFRPAWPKRFRSSGSRISTLIFSARARANLSGLSASKGLSVCCSNGTRNPVSPSTITSLMPPTALPTTGVSQAIASRLMMPKGS